MCWNFFNWTEKNLAQCICQIVLEMQMFLIKQFVNQQEAEEQRRNSQFSFVDGSRCREGSTQEMLESAHQGSQEFPEGQKEAVNASAHGSHPRMLSVGAFSRHDPQPTPPDWQSSQHPPYSNHLSNVPSS